MTDAWREYATCAIEDALTVLSFNGPEEAKWVLESAMYVLHNFDTAPSVEPPRKYPSKFLGVRKEQ